MKLQDLMVGTKQVWVNYPGLKDFEVEVAILSRKELTKLRKAATITKFDRKSRLPVESLDEEAFVEKFTAATLKNWKGLKLKHLETLILVDTEGQDLEEELEYTQENAEALVSNSSEFDEFLNGVAFDLENFRS